MLYSTPVKDRPTIFKPNHENLAVHLLWLALAFAACLMPAQADTWWQLRTGEEMWRSGRIMLRDEFTHTVAGGAWPNHEWLSQIVFYAAYVLGGLPLLTALCAAAVTLAWIIVSDLTAGPRLWRVALIGTGAMLSSVSWSLRPQTFTLALFAATLWILVRRRYVWSLPIIFLLWSNLHGAVALGGVLVIAAFLSTAIVSRADLKPLAVTGALCLAATAITPLGVSLWLEIPQSFARLQLYGVYEWRTPSPLDLQHLPFWAITAGVLFTVYLGRARLRSLDVLTLTVSTALLFCLACRSARNIPPFLVCAVPTIATLLQLSPRQATIGGGNHHSRVYAVVLATFAFVACVFVSQAWVAPLARLGWKPVNDQLTAAIRNCEGPLYNRYDEGGYLVWFLKDRKVFMDSRQDPFPPELILEQIRVESSGDYGPLFNQFRIRCALVSRGSALDKRLSADGWRQNAVGDWRVYEHP